MSDPKARAFQALLARRKRIAEQLRAQLGAQQRELEKLVAARDDARENSKRALDAEHACDARIDEMMTGTGPIRLPDINAHRRHRETLCDQRIAKERRMRECDDAVARHETQMAQTRQRIVRNDHSIDLYRDRLESMKRLAEIRTEELAHEEAEEAHAARVCRRGAGSSGSERRS